MKKTGKLVRDRIPELAGNKDFTTRRLKPREFQRELRRKLREEVNEYLEEGSVVELVDVLEVVRALAESQGVSAADLERLRRKKAHERGAFKSRFYLSPRRHR